MRQKRNIRRSTRFRVLRRDGFSCRYCGATYRATVLHVDHLVPLAKGGSNGEENLITACRDCNLGKGILDAEEPPPRLEAALGMLQALERELRSAGVLQPDMDRIIVFALGNHTRRRLLETAVDYVFNQTDEDAEVA